MPTRSPTASSRNNCACTSPSLRASADTLSRTNWSLRSISSRETNETKSERIGIRNTDAARTVKNENAPDNSSTPNANVIEAASAWRRVTLSVKARANRLSTTMICIRALLRLPRTAYPLPMSSSARLIATALRDSPQAASLIARWEATQRAALASPPHVASLPASIPLEPGVCELRGETLWLSLPSPSHSAKLRQAAPRLLSTLAADGFRVYEIKTRVQPAVTSYPGDGSPEPSSHRESRLPWPRTNASRPRQRWPHWWTRWRNPRSRKRLGDLPRRSESGAAR